MPSRRIEFDNGRGQRLAARLDLPVDGAPDAYAMLAHCFTCSKDLRGLRRLSSALAQAGFAVLRLDFTGLGESEGEFAQTSFSSNVEDVVAAASHLEEHYQAPALLVGHSLGGAAVLAAAPHLPSVRAVATVGAPADQQHVERLIIDSRTAIETQGEALVDIGGRPFTVRREFLEDLRRSRLSESVAELRRPLLLLHSPSDEVVGIDNARRLFDAAKHPKSFVSLDRADHLLSDPGDADLAGSLIASWARRYLERPYQADWKSDPLDNRVMARTERGLRTEILADGFGLVADEPASLGGTETGPTPYDLLASALGACTTMTLRMYADRKGWPLLAAQVRVKHSKVHAEDSAEDSQGTTLGGKMDRFERELELLGALDDAQRARLLEIANRCPVHRTLEEGPTLISTRLLEAKPTGEVAD
ncbi:MAG: bifunctional alpha/beta hydrolase/OsmC family protein [Trueperaceae bacterium]